jgi:hypothetical protein
VVFVANLEVTFPEFFVPADLIEQVLNGDHVQIVSYQSFLLCAVTPYW